MAELETVYIAGGCLWGVQHFLRGLPGVIATEAGRANGTGNTLDGSYDGYAECVKTLFDPEVLSFSRLMEYFFEIIDPYSINKQGIDVGPKYRTGIYSGDAAHLEAAKRFIGARPDREKIAVEVLPLTNYIPSAPEHQDHLVRCPGDYCHISPEIMNRYRAPMRVRKTVEADLPRVMEIYARARTFMAEHGNPNQWGPTNWPPEALIRQDIAAGKGHVCVDENGMVIGSFFYDFGPDIEPCYLDIQEGTWQHPGPYGVVHRIASDGSRKGIGAFCIGWAYSQHGRLRMDTHGDNIVMQNLLTKLGFEKRGIIHVTEDHYPRFAYEK